MRRRRRGSDNNLSFLDVVSCGFGAIVLLILIAKTADGPPAEDFSRLTEWLRGQLAAAIVRRDRARDGEQAAREKVERERERLAAERAALERARQDRTRAQADAQAAALIEDRLKAALQNLNEEMRRLELKPPAPDVIGGIPADSEYIIFIVDTSGSMQRFAWEAAMKQMTALLDAYPEVRGMQVMNDMGSYMFHGYRGRWIPDTPERRRIVLRQFRRWHSYSNSSPVEGIVAAIRTFRTKSDKISLYVLGDEFTGESIEAVIRAVDRMNHIDGERQVRIHGVGFFTREEIEKIDPTYANTTARFATLMRELTRRNGGTFLGVEAN